MSDDEADQELLDLLRKSLGIIDGVAEHPRIQVLEDAEFVNYNATDVALDMQGTKAAASDIHRSIEAGGYSTRAWRSHELHPQTKDPSTVNFIFAMDLLNFSFWSSSDDPSLRYAVEYRGRQWTGYRSLVAALQRALEDDIPITTPSHWADPAKCSDDTLRHVFRSSTIEDMPMLDERIRCLRDAGRVVQDHFDGTFINILEKAEGSAAALVDLLVKNFQSFDDCHHFEGRRVRFYKRAQILVADLWACFEGEGYGKFSDIDQITMFADYRLPQVLHSMRCISYSPPLESHIKQKKTIESGHSWEIQMRGCSIWCVELIRREIVSAHPDTHINAILIDFFLYDTMQEMQAQGKESIEHHRTRSVYY